jgi:hypothetical protein
MRGKTPAAADANTAMNETAGRPRAPGPAGGKGQQMKITSRRWWLAAAAAASGAGAASDTPV